MLSRLRRCDVVLWLLLAAMTGALAVRNASLAERLRRLAYAVDEALIPV